MSLKVPLAFLFVVKVLDGLPLQSKEHTGSLAAPIHRYAIFKNPQGEDVLVDLKPETGLSVGFKKIKSVIDPSYIGYYLYTKDTVNDTVRIYVDDNEALLKAGYNPKAKTKIIIHGFLNSYESDTVQSIKNNLFTANHEEYNVIAVDWSTYTYVYLEVNEKAKEVGTQVGAFIDYLVNVGTSMDDIHCIGHSLGAHACGFAGKTTTKGKIARISGLDPALPGFNVGSADSRLEASDARFVDCIHTCGGFLGIDEPICAADYYPNKGKNQPGCHWYDLGSCSHGRSHEFYAESILDGHLFPSRSCSSLDFSADNCDFKGALMGYPATEKHIGIFYLQTNDQYPYAINITDY